MAFGQLDQFSAEALRRAARPGVIEDPIVTADDRGPRNPAARRVGKGRRKASNSAVAGAQERRARRRHRNRRTGRGVQRPRPPTRRAPASTAPKPFLSSGRIIFSPAASSAELSARLGDERAQIGQTVHGAKSSDEGIRVTGQRMHHTTTSSVCRAAPRLHLVRTTGMLPPSHHTARRPSRPDGRRLPTGRRLPRAEPFVTRSDGFRRWRSEPGRLGVIVDREGSRLTGPELRTEHANCGLHGPHDKDPDGPGVVHLPERGVFEVAAERRFRGDAAT